MISNERLFAVAVAYYANGRRQQEIAEELGVSHVQVGKYLRLAQERGIVEITLNPPYVTPEDQNRYNLLLKEMFGLKKLVLVPGANSEKHAYSFLVEGAVNYLLQAFPNVSTNVGFGLGRTMNEISTAKIRTVDRRNSWRYFPLLNYNLVDDPSVVGRADYFSYKTIADNFVRCWGGGVDRNFMELLRLETEQGSSLLNADAFWDSLDVIIGGVGVPFSREPNVRRAMFGDATAKELAGKDIPGDYLNYFFDSDGNIYAPQVHGRQMISWERIASVPRKIAVASGYQKVSSIIGLLKCDVVDTLITDIATARNIVDSMK